MVQASDKHVEAQNGHPDADARAEIGKAIFYLAARYGLVDEYADAPGHRGGTYVGTVNGRRIECQVFDRNPSADLAALEAAIREAEAA